MKVKLKRKLELSINDIVKYSEDIIKFSMECDMEGYLKVEEIEEDVFIFEVSSLRYIRIPKRFFEDKGE